MNIAIFATVFSVLSTRVRCQNEVFLQVKLINRLNDFFGFEHNIFFLDSSIDQNHYIPSMMYNNDDGTSRAQTVYTFEHNSSDTQLAILSAVNIPYSLVIVVGKSFELTNNTKLWQLVRGMQVLNPDIKIGMFFAVTLTSMVAIEQLFQHSWRFRIVNVLCAFYLNTEDEATEFNVFRFDPFVTYGLINVTGSESFLEYFPDSVRIQFASVSWGPNKSRFEIGIAVVRDFAASSTPVNKRLVRGFEQEFILFETIVPSTHRVRTYPHRILKLVLLVPHAQPFSNFFVFLQNATWKIIFVYTFIAIVAASLLLAISSYLKTKKFQLFQCVVDVMNLLMNDNGSIQYRQLHHADVYIILPFTFAGLIVVNGILSVFQSYITLPIYDGQIKTHEELFQSSVLILNFDDFMGSRTIAALDDLSQHGGWGDKELKTNAKQFFKELRSFNSSVAYPLGYDDAQMRLEAQKRLNLKALYMISEPSLESYFMSFYLDSERRFPLEEPVNRLIHQMVSAGLVVQWNKIANEWSFKYQQQKSVYVPVPSKVVTVNDSSEFSVPAVVWWGWIAGLIVFMCEIIWHKINSQTGKIQKRIFWRVKQ